MKRVLIIVFLLLCLLGLIGYKTFVHYTSTTTPSAYQPEQSFTEERREGNLEKHVKELCKYPDRYAENTDQLAETIQYIKEQFESAGLKTELIPFKHGNKVYYNISGIIPGSMKDRIVIGTHYDSAKGSPGADDDASSVAALIETAKGLAGIQPDYTIEFVAYANEKSPLHGTDYHGSRIHYRHLEEEGIPVQLMICLEMIGYYSNDPNSQTYPKEWLSKIYPETGNFIAILGSETATEPSQILQTAMKHRIPTVRLNYPILKEFTFSDHSVFDEQGIPSIVLTDTSFYRNKNYHQPTDTPDTLDYEKMQWVVKGLIDALNKFSFNE